MILIFGPPGSGKGTQAALLQEAGLVQWFSIGEILRQQLSDGAERSKMTKGDLVSNQLTTTLLRQKIEEHANKELPILLDGYPRSLAQIGWLFSADNPSPVRGILQLVAPREKLEKRLQLRSQIEKRSDDNPETIRRRFEIYNQQSLLAIEKLKQRGITVEQVDADQSIEAVGRDCQAALLRLLELHAHTS